MKHAKLGTLSAIIIGSLCVSAQAETTSNGWGNWDSKQSQQDTFFSLQAIPESELLETQEDFVPTDQNFSLFGTQLTGTPYQGLDTDPMELDENGVPVALSGG